MVPEGSEQKYINIYVHLSVLELLKYYMISPDWILSQYLRMTGFASKSIQTSAGRVHYFEKHAKNSKALLVLVHGVGACSGHYYKIADGLVRDGYSVLIPDLIGHGNSDEPEGDSTPENFYKSFVEWMEQVISEDCVLVGNSLGGAVCLKYAAEYSQQVRQLVLISPAGGFVTKEDWDTFKKGLTFESIEDSKRHVPKIFHKPPIYLRCLYRPFLQTMSRPGLKSLIQTTEFEDFQVFELFKKLPSTLVIWGKSEKLFSIKHLDHFKKHLPGHVVFEEPNEVGHCPQLDNPKWIRDRLAQLL
jgi:pimeloyl-ACP methyl ester carboxylesterase